MAKHPLALLADANLSTNDYRVITVLLGELDTVNWIVVSQSTLARKLNIRRQSVHRTIKRLVAMGALLKAPGIGLCHSYRFNPKFGSEEDKPKVPRPVVNLAQARKRRTKILETTELIEGEKSG